MVKFMSEVYAAFTPITTDRWLTPLLVPKRQTLRIWFALRGSMFCAHHQKKLLTHSLPVLGQIITCFFGVNYCKSKGFGEIVSANFVVLPSRNTWMHRDTVPLYAPVPTLPEFLKALSRARWVIFFGGIGVRDNGFALLMDLVSRCALTSGQCSLHGGRLAPYPQTPFKKNKKSF